MSFQHIFCLSIYPLETLSTGSHLRTIRTCALFFVSLLLISGCATRPPLVADPEQRWQTHLADVAGLRSWQATGRVGVKADNDGWTASFSWQQTGDAFNIRIHGPLGRGMVELEGTPQQVVLKQAGQPARMASSAEQLLFQETGWSLPVSGLRYWILGVPLNGQHETHDLNTEGALQHLNQAGWKIEYTGYRHVDGLYMPAKFHLSNGNIKVKLIASEWRLSKLQ